MLVGLEMDEERMSFLSLDPLPAPAVSFGLAIHLAAGTLLGILYFRSLWWTVRRFAAGGRALTAVAWMIGRTVLLCCLLTLASLEGALPLLMMALGMLLARSAIMRRVRETAR